MTKIREYAKALAALLGSLATFLVTVNAPAEWSMYLGSVVAILTGVATFGIPNRPKAVAPVSPVDQAIGGLQGAIQQQVDAQQQVSAAESELTRLKDAATTILGQVPVVGSLASQVINSVTRF